MNVLIRSEDKKDYDGIRMINDLAFNQINEGVLIEQLRDNPEYIAELSLVAIVEDEIVGHILFFPVKIKNKSKIHRSLSLAPMAVHPDFQNKGIGSKLIIEGLKKAIEFGYNSVIVVGHPSYYPRFGFKPASKWKISLPFEVPDEAFMALELKPDALKNCSGIVGYSKEYENAL
ncbi:MAG: N-acetyltransferase [Thermoplasmatales archaeon]|nr:MAG: N-acetyltransferase [Thermoplasmatales archaeon]